MKNLLFLLICLELFSCTEKKKIKNDLTKDNLKGSVKSITSNTYKGVIKSEVVEKDSLKGTDVCIYNERGFLMEYSFKRNDSLIPWKALKYDAANNLIEKDFDYGGKLVPVELDKYDRNNNMIEQITFEHEWKSVSDSMIKSDIHFTYQDSADCQIAKSIANRKGKPWYSRINILNNKGDVIKERIFYPWDTDKKSNIQIGIYKYDVNGNMLEKDCFDAKNALDFRFVNKYDLKGNKTEEIARRRGDSIEFREVKTYDTLGNMTAYSFYKHDGSFDADRHFEYKKFDEAGNWLEQITYNKGKLESITNRTIKYY